MADSSKLMNSVPQPVMDAIYRDYPAYRAIVTIIQHLEDHEDVSLDGRLVGIAEGEATYPVISFRLERDAVATRFLTISCQDEIFFTFESRSDLEKFIELAGLEDAKTGRALWLDGDPYPAHLERTLAVRSKSFEYPIAAKVLATVLAGTPLRRLLPRDDDSKLQ